MGIARYASEWLEAGEEFPSGMAALSRKVRKAGFEFGVWLAPWITNVDTRVAREHPEWMVRERGTGEILRKPASNVGACCMLDFSIREACEWLQGIVRTMVREWKIGYLKLDGPCLAHWRGGVFRDPEATTVSVAREALRIIREECGDGVIVEGEGVYLPAGRVRGRAAHDAGQLADVVRPRHGHPGAEAEHAARSDERVFARAMVAQSSRERDRARLLVAVPS